MYVIPVASAQTVEIFMFFIDIDMKCRNLNITFFPVTYLAHLGNGMFATPPPMVPFGVRVRVGLELGGGGFQKEYWGFKALSKVFQSFRSQERVILRVSKQVKNHNFLFHGDLNGVLS